MTSLSPFLNGLPAFSGAAAPRVTPHTPTVRECCDELLADIPDRHRERIYAGLDRMRRADDLWQLRVALYTAIALAHGEPEARKRLARFDAVVKG